MEPVREPQIDLLDPLRALEPHAGGPRPGEGLLVAVSGGADSVALLDLLVRLAPERDLKLVAAHLDHGLRPDSDADLQFCQELCQSRQVLLVTERIDVREEAARTGEGIEAAGRNARYRWLEELVKTRGLDTIATGHHLDDHVETLLLWLGRGTGLNGLRGISPRRGTRLRPLRELHRSQLHEYLRWRGLSWREDPSNRDPSRQRNRLRHEAIPLLEEIFGAGFGERLAGFAERANGDLDGLERLGAQALADCLLEQRGRGAARVVTIDRPRYLELDEVLQRQVLWRIVARFRRIEGGQKWNAERVRDVLSFSREGQAGKRCDLPGGGWLLAERSTLQFVGPDADPKPRAELPRLHQEVLPRPDGVVNFWQNDEAVFDADRVRPPLKLRTVLPGDRLRPFGMDGHKKLVTLMREREVPRHLRSGQLVVEDANGIIWAVGLTTSEDTRVTDSTQRVLRLRLESE